MKQTFLFLLMFLTTSLFAFNTTRSFTVKIKLPDKGSGTGIQILLKDKNNRDKAFILTADHVLKTLKIGDPVTLRNALGNEFTGTVWARDWHHDIALLEPSPLLDIGLATLGDSRTIQDQEDHLYNEGYKYNSDLLDLNKNVIFKGKWSEPNRVPLIKDGIKLETLADYGFSGSPVIDLQTNTVLAILISKGNSASQKYCNVYASPIHEIKSLIEKMAKQELRLYQTTIDYQQQILWYRGMGFRQIKERMIDNSFIGDPHGIGGVIPPEGIELVSINETELAPNRRKEFSDLFTSKENMNRYFVTELFLKERKGNELTIVQKDIGNLFEFASLAETITGNEFEIFPPRLRNVNLPDDEYPTSSNNGASTLELLFKSTSLLKDLFDHNGNKTLSSLFNRYSKTIYATFILLANNPNKNYPQKLLSVLNEGIKKGQVIPSTIIFSFAKEPYKAFYEDLMKLERFIVDKKYASSKEEVDRFKE